MLIAYLTVSFVLGLFLSFVWTTNGFANTAIKVGFSIYTLWTAALLIGTLVPLVSTTGMRLF